MAKLDDTGHFLVGLYFVACMLSEDEKNKLDDDNIGNIIIDAVLSSFLFYKNLLNIMESKDV